MRKLLICVVAVFQALSLIAQNAPLKSLYFQNPYLQNPAMAGNEGRSAIYCNYNNQWNRIEGSPQMMSVSVSFPLAERAAAGFNIITEKAGLLERTQTMGSYAYNVSISEKQSLRFGLSLSWTADHADDGNALPDENADPFIAVYNDNRHSYLDGNFGLAWKGEKMELQFSYLNLSHKRFKEYSTVDYATFYSSLSYLFTPDRNITVKPLLVYRGVKDYNNQFDFAAEWNLKELLIVYSIFHSNKSFTGGLGYDYQHKLNISAWYNTGAPKIRSLTGGTIDLVMGFIF